MFKFLHRKDEKLPILEENQNELSLGLNKVADRLNQSLDVIEAKVRLQDEPLHYMCVFFFNVF